MEKEKIILFYGCDSQVGTTMMALSAAEQLAAEGKSVLLIHGAGTPGNSFLSVELPGDIRSLYGSFADGTMDIKDLRELASEQDEFDCLPGLGSWRPGRGWMDGILEEICRISARNWDYVIIDGGNCGEISAGSDALALAGKIFLVATQQEKSLFRWKQRRKQMEAISKDCVCYVVNKFVDSRAFYTEKQLLQELACEEKKMFLIPYVPYGWQAEAEHRSLMKYRRFRKGILKITETIKYEWEEKGTVNYDSGTGV